MASCFYNGGTTRDVANIISSDREGAGVISASQCYSMAKGYKYDNFTLTSYGRTQKGVTISDVTKSLRVAIAWRTENASDASFNNTNIILHVRKDGENRLVASSSAIGYLYTSIEDLTGPVVNYQYVEIPAATLASKGAGDYLFEIIVNSTQATSLNIPLAIAWTQN